MPDEFTAHFPQRTDASWCGYVSAAFIKSQFWQKANITRIYSSLASRALWVVSILCYPSRAPAAFHLERCFHLSGGVGGILSVWFNALHSRVRFVTFCQVKCEFALSLPIEDHFRCLSESQCAVSIHISFMESLSVQQHLFLCEMLSLGVGLH